MVKFDKHMKDLQEWWKGIAKELEEDLETTGS